MSLGKGKEAFLTIDCGTGSVRAAVVDSSGVIHSIRSAEINYQKVLGNGLEYNPETVWSDILNLLKSLIHEFSDIFEIAGISVTSQRNGCVLYDDNMKELIACPNIDMRVTPDTLETLSNYSEVIYRKTGRWPNVYFMAMRLFWIKHHQPRVFEKIKYASMINDWIAYRLTGRLCSEPTNAVESVLYNLHTGCWSNELKSILGIDKVQLPELVESASCIGNILSEVQEVIGLKNKIGAYLAPADTQSALIGCGMTEIGDVGVVNGSTTPVLMLTSNPVFDNEKHRTWTDPYWNSLFALESNCGRSGFIYHKFVNNLNQFLTVLGIDKIFTEAEIEKISVGSGLNKSTLMFPGTAICNFSVPVLAKNFLQHDFSNENLFTQYFTAGVEAIAFASLANIKQLEDICSIKCRKVYLTGGGARSPYFRAIIASLRSDVEVVYPETFETTSLGAAIAGFSVKNKQQHDLSEYVKTFNLTHNSSFLKIQDIDMLGQRYESWVSLYKKNSYIDPR
jgi:autoinducer-2 kinase